MSGEHIAAMDLYSMGGRAVRLGAERLVVGPAALELLCAMFPVPDDPPGADEEGVTVEHTLMGLPISDDVEVPDFGWQAHAGDGRVVCAGRLTVHSGDCQEDLP